MKSVVSPSGTAEKPILGKHMSIVEVKVPQLSESVAEATMLQWKKKAGDTVSVD